MKGNQINGQLVTEKDLLALGYRKYYGKDLDIYYNQAICAHVGNCVRGDSGVFEVGRKPWIIADNGESADHSIAVVDSCPSGALKWVRHDS
ncbi:hypothetical protein Hs30E_15940 [Lactococcus hodotermopsidis]|uniref:Divergent 4Fe-4S mono-cluster domain-containing protein n=1 Tax=Pseudolactococcus hodotermopsidis TaxID=2709157 RepID=A0A6A0BEB4_9LACT|nr:(4Fe-4S)-binding protein [Lactococcus hodotermopsidis]GFH43043.1 hypothetical protein Hs30E_15940 [Lactococcus hodotermopsidis]